MNNRHLLLQFFTFFSLILASSVAVFAQGNGSIKGHVSTSDNRPAENVTIFLKQGQAAAITDEQGNFLISRVRAGVYALRASAVGLTSSEQQVTVVAGETAEVWFTLAESASTLRDVVVSSGKINPLYKRKSESVARLPLQNLENPQSYVTINKDLLKMQVITNFNDALKNSSGLDKLWTSTGRAGDGAAYYTLRGFATQPTMVNGVAGVTNGDIDPTNIESIEVIKGPSGTLFGGALTNFGGLINILTKKPIDTIGGEVSYTTGSYNLNRLTADIYGPVSKDKKLLARFNGAYNYRGTFQDAGFGKSFMLAPSIEYNASERLKINLDAQFYNYEGTNPLSIFLNRARPLIARTPDELQFDYYKSYTNNDVTVKTPTVNVSGRVSYKISDQWTSQTSFSRGYRKSDGYYQYVMYTGASDTLISRLAAKQNAASDVMNVQQNFVGDFQIAGLRNRLVVGVDYLRQENDNFTSPYVTFDQVNTSLAADPRYGQINRIKIDDKIAASTAAYTNNNTVSYVYSAYASNVLNVTDQLMAMASIRVDRFDNRGSYNKATGQNSSAYKQTAWSPKFGLVYQIVPERVSLFGNYMNGFRNVAPVTQPLPDISGVLKPQHANQIEGGVKLQAFNNMLNLTASYYDISVSNMTTAESVVRDGQTYNITVQRGTQESKGFELDLVSNPVQGLNVVAGYSYNDSKLTKSSPVDEGLRPVSAGPKSLANLWLNYIFTKPALKGIGLGFGGNYGSENKITNNTVTGAFTLPSYTVLNAALSYNAKTWRVGLKVDNLSNEKYYKGWTTVEMQMPRSILASLSMRF